MEGKKIITAQCDTCYVFSCYKMLMPAESWKQGTLPEEDWQGALKEVSWILKKERSRERREAF